MSEDLLRYCATDKEIYDLLMSARQRINEAALLDMAKRRGIFYSPNAERELLVSQISLLPHDYDSLREMLGQSENPNRAEKVTSVTIARRFTTEEIRTVVDAFRDQGLPQEDKLTSRADGAEKFHVQLEYSEFDFAKTRLLQRRKREADIRFVTNEESTTIRLPANDRAKQIVEVLTGKLRSVTNSDAAIEQIEISGLTADQRTIFFTSLISKMPGYTLRDVNNLKVQSGAKPGVSEDAGDEEEEDDETVQAREEMLAVVENVALNGQSLLASPEYQDLRRKGFYITSITWVSQQTTTPFNKIEFEAGFEEPKEGTGFRYNIRGLYRRTEAGEFTKTLRPLTSEHKHDLFPMIEKTAREVLNEISAEGNAPAAGVGE